MRRRKLLFAGAAVLSGGFAGSPGIGKVKKPFSVPPEEDRHELTFMQWPVSTKVHDDRRFLKLLQKTIADIANTINEFEPVVMLASRAEHRSARKILTDSIELWDIPTEDLWCRDSGPLFAKTVSGELVVSHIRFNGWGGKQIHRHDGQIAERVAEHLGLPVISSGLTGEAGGVEHDGHGLLMAHESSWINKNRNPGIDKAVIEDRLLKAYGANRMLWSAGVRGEDITDYHIDSLARFTGAGRVLINLPDDPDLSDPFHVAAVDTYDMLVDAGLQIEVIPEPVERRINSVEFVASYANYYVCNGAVIAARFGDQVTDQIAVDTLKKHYSGREVVTLNVDALGEIGGGIHCATQQMPVAR